MATVLNREWGAELGYSEAETRDWCCQVAGSTTEALIAVLKSEQLIGKCMLVESELPEATDLAPWLSSLWVRPACRRNGVGTRLIETVIEMGRQQRRDALYLYCRVGMLSQLYQRRGWFRIGSTEIGGMEGWIMKRAVSNC